jgi:hypothetical protein
VVLKRALAGLLFLGSSGSAACRPEEPALAFVSDPESEHFGTVLLTGVNRPRDWPDAFMVRVEDADPDVPPVLGDYAREGDSVRFRPRFSFAPGLTYRGRFENVEIAFTMPARLPDERPRVAAVYPSSAEVPENLLRLYVHFSHPMRAKDVPGRIHLYDAEGRELPLPFVEIETGLWDPEGKRLTLFFHPGRIKRGVGPNVALGPPLANGRTYRLVVDREMKDARGYELERAFEKEIRVGPEDRTSPDPSAWNLHPVADRLAPLEVDLDEPLDRALLLRLLRVETVAGKRVPGIAAAGSNETRFTFTPEEPWPPGSYRLLADPEIEDLAGNKPGRLFDEEAGGPKADLRAVELSFDVR